MTRTVKNYLWIICLILVVTVLCLFTYKVATADYGHAIQNTEIEAIVQEHKPHTHEHAGLACCPCGVCHKHDEDEENENAIKDPAWWLRLIALGTFTAIMMSVILGIFWC